VLDTQKLIRALRDFSPAVLGLLLVLAVVHGGCLRAWGIGAVIGLLIAGTAGYVACRALLPNKPDRAVLWVEVRTYGLIGGTYILCYAAVMFVFWTLASRIHSDPGKYFVSAASGFAVALLTTALIKPGESDSWLAHWWKETYHEAFKPFFSSSRGDGGAWLPDGRQSKALQQKEFDGDSGRISGWGFRARRARARFLRAKMADLKRVRTTDVKVDDWVKVINDKNEHYNRLGQVCEIRTNEKFPVLIDFDDPEFWWGLRREALRVVHVAG